MREQKQYYCLSIKRIFLIYDLTHSKNIHSIICNSTLIRCTRIYCSISYDLVQPRAFVVSGDQRTHKSKTMSTKRTVPIVSAASCAATVGNIEEGPRNKFNCRKNIIIHIFSVFGIRKTKKLVTEIEFEANSTTVKRLALLNQLTVHKHTHHVLNLLFDNFNINTYH